MFFFLLFGFLSPPPSLKLPFGWRFEGRMDAAVGIVRAPCQISAVSVTPSCAAVGPVVKVVRQKGAKIILTNKFATMLSFIARQVNGRCEKTKSPPLFPKQ